MGVIPWKFESSPGHQTSEGKLRFPPVPPFLIRSRSSESKLPLREYFYCAQEDEKFILSEECSDETK